jgi:hypothetical protein
MRAIERITTDFAWRGSGLEFRFSLDGMLFGLIKPTSRIVSTVQSSQLARCRRSAIVQTKGKFSLIHMWPCDLIQSQFCRETLATGATQRVAHIVVLWRRDTLVIAFNRSNDLDLVILPVSSFQRVPLQLLHSGCGALLSAGGRSGTINSLKHKRSPVGWIHVEKFNP